MIESLRQKLEQKEREFTACSTAYKECKVCFEPFDNDRHAMAFFPCGHARCCRSCYHSLSNPKKCPECRVKIQKAAVLFY